MGLYTELFLGVRRNLITAMCKIQGSQCIVKFKPKSHAKALKEMPCYKDLIVAFIISSYRWKCITK